MADEAISFSTAAILKMNTYGESNYVLIEYVEKLEKKTQFIFFVIDLQ